MSHQFSSIGLIIIFSTIQSSSYGKLYAVIRTYPGVALYNKTAAVPIVIGLAFAQ